MQEETGKKPLKIGDLVQLYENAKSLDREATAEMRNNILLVAGEQWSKKLTEYFVRARPSSQLPDNQKLRITKNNLHRAHRLYMSSIWSLAPGVRISPRNPLELKDKKDAELNQSVWNYLKDKYKLKSHFRDSLSDFCGIGECATVMKFDPAAGYVKGYEAAVDETGQQLMDEYGQAVPDESKPVMSGEFVYSRRYAQNIFRDPSCQQMKDAKWIGFEVVESTKELKRKYSGNPEKLKMIVSSNEDYVVFDTNKNGYATEKDQTVILEKYVKPCADFPSGYFYIFTKAGILEEGELPFGIWPVVWQGFDEHATKVRATSMVKIGRPFQAELNRASSQVALHQITVSEDKILYQDGAALTQGAMLPGVRGIKYQGNPPTILPGRSGEQYFEYIDRQYAEMDRALLIDQLDQEKMNNLDPFALIFRSMSQQQKFNFYADKFGEFLVEFAQTALELAKRYLPDDEVIAAVGKSEAISIAEFRSTTPLCHTVHLEEGSETPDTKLGKQLVLNQILQYSSGQLNREDIGRLITQMPFGDWEPVFKDLMIDSKNIQNDFLALDRGEMPPVTAEDDSDYVLKQLGMRKKERDFALLHPYIQSLYAQYEQIHSQKKAKELQDKKALESEFIPTGGAMVACDLYVPAEDPTKAPKRARIPYQSLDWLLKVLEKQGMTMQAMDQMEQAQVSGVAAAMGQLPPPHAMGQVSPMGA